MIEVKIRSSNEYVPEKGFVIKILKITISGKNYARFKRYWQSGLKYYDVKLQRW